MLDVNEKSSLLIATHLHPLPQDVSQFVQLLVVPRHFQDLAVRPRRATRGTSHDLESDALIYDQIVDQLCIPKEQKQFVLRQVEDWN